MKPGTPVGKIARRLGVTPTHKTAKVVIRRPEPPGAHGARRRRNRSVYGQQLIEKQKLRFQFMISEKALRRAFSEAKRAKGMSGEALIQRLDRRLDATIFRADVVRSIPAARQLVTHRHVFVNGSRVTSPSYLLNVGDEITFSEKARKFAFLREGFEEANPGSYNKIDKENFTISRTNDPERKDIPIICEEQLVVEWYSR